MGLPRPRSRFGVRWTPIRAARLILSSERVFLLGPSHAWSLDTCALSNFDVWGTPLGDLPLDGPTCAALRATGEFDTMPAHVDENEHSLELHLPYLHRTGHRVCGRPLPLVPILVGHTTPAVERAFGGLLAPYLADPANVFVISSDFAHWGLRFQYTYYIPDLADVDRGITLRAADRHTPTHPTLAASIAAVDRTTLDAIEAGHHAEYLRHLRATGNTVCGRHPIGVVLAAREALARDRQIDGDESTFRFIQYARSSECRTVLDSSVSYASGFATLRPLDGAGSARGTGQLEAASPTT